MYHGHYRLVRDGAEQICAELRQNPLEGVLASNNHIAQGAVAQGSLVTRAATLVGALIR